jgi:hypothetical protein
LHEIYLRKMDLTDDEDDYVSSSKALDEGELFKMKSVARRERESRLSSYDQEARNQAEKRKELLAEIFNRTLDDFNGDKIEFAKYEEFREMTIWYDIKQFDQWQYSTLETPEEWVDFPVKDMKLLSAKFKKKGTSKVVEGLANGKTATLGASMTWRDQCGPGGNVRYLSTKKKKQDEIAAHKDIIGKNKIRQRDEEEKRKKDISSCITVQKRQNDEAVEEDKKEEDKMRAKLRVDYDEDETSFRKKRFNTIASVYLERDAAELEGSLHVFGNNKGTS